MKDIPLQEITLRKYEVPTTLENRELARKFLLSIGMLQPGDSRDIIVDIYYTILRRHKQQGGDAALALAKEDTNGFVSVSDVENALEGKKGASKPNIRRQLRRLTEVKLIKKQGGKYTPTENGKVSDIVENYLEMFVVKPTVERIKQYAEKLDKINKNK